jgi:NitT/TauT family transport system permease protein
MWLPATGIVAMLLVWQIAALVARDVSILPGPAATATAAWKLLAGGYWRDLLATSARACVALALALAVGVPTGLLLGWFEKLYDSFRAVLSFLRCLPAYLLIVVFAAVGHGGETARVATAALASAWIIADECAESLRTLPPDRIDVLRAFRASDWFILTRALFFEALGRTIVPSAKTAVGICFVVTTVVESLAIPTYGVGARLLSFFAGAELAPVFGFLLLTGLAGVALSTLVHRTARTVIFWS